MHRFLGWQLVLYFAGISLGPVMARAQARGHWYVADGDEAHSGWQNTETKISVDTVQGSFQFLWKIKLGNDAARVQSFSEPFFIPSLISSRGFKDIALWGDSNTLYAVDYALGTLLWKKDFKIKLARASGTCGSSNLQMILELPHVNHADAKPVPASTPKTDERWVGAPPAGGGFALKGIYVLTGDGYLHEQILATGLDYAPPVRFLPASTGDVFGLNMDNKILYTESKEGCGNTPNAVWSIDLNTPEHPIDSYQSKKVSPAELTGPAIGSDGTLYVLTGSGTSDLSSGIYANSVVALTAGNLKVKDWYSPSDSVSARMLHVSPVVIRYKDKDLLAAADNDGSLALLDSGSLGGSDHHTPLAQTSRISKDTKKDAWESLASWKDKNDQLWVFASISGPVQRNVTFAYTNGDASHGSIIAFKIQEKDGHTVLTPGWISRDLRNPAPPVIANGVVFALAGGYASNHAMLYALDTTTGKELYSSGDAIDTYTHLSGMSVGDGHVFLTTRDNTLYCFGIPMEH